MTISVICTIIKFVDIGLAAFGIYLWIRGLAQGDAEELFHGKLVLILACLMVITLLFLSPYAQKEKFNEAIEKGYTFYIDGEQVAAELLKEPSEYYKIEFYDDEATVRIMSKKTPN